MTARATGQRFRQRKLSTKQNLPVVREHEVEQLADDDASRHIPKVETGVEKGEEIVSCASLVLDTYKTLIFIQRMQMPCTSSPLPYLGLFFSFSSYLGFLFPRMLMLSVGAPSTSRHLCRPGSSTGHNWWEGSSTLHPDPRCCRK